MVYCGKPSRGCQMCRTRRIKCDETKPTCNQCTKSRRQCPGYKDEFDLVFRNETQATERRAKRANQKALASMTQKSAKVPISPTDSEMSLSLSPTSTASGSSRSPIEGIIRTIEIPVEQQAECHFVSNFILVPQQDGTRGFMDFVLPLMRCDSPNGVLSYAFRACAYATLGNRPNVTGSAIPEMAISQYQRALEALQVVLRDPEQSKADATLTAVLLLGLYENITAKEMGMLSWGRHIEGAIQLTKARGREQLTTKIGLFLFVAVRTQMIVQTMAAGKAPLMGVDWWVTDAVQDEIATRASRMNILTCELRAEVTEMMTTVSRNPRNIQLMVDVVQRARAIDSDITAWMRSLPPPWHFKAVTWEDSIPNRDYSKAEVFPGRVDVYRDFWIASVHNMVRVSRLTLASIMVRCVAWASSPIDYRTSPEYALAARTCADTITDIIASVPYHLGWHLKRPDILRRANLSAFACGEEDSQKGLAGYFLTYPLASVYCQDYCTDAQRAWVAGRLKYIGDEMGVRYAHILAQLEVRLPSMLIRRDGLLAQPYPMAYNFEKLLSSRFPTTTTGPSMDPLQQREAMRKEFVSQRKAELVAKARGKSGESGEWLAQKILTV